MLSVHPHTAPAPGRTAAPASLRPFLALTLALSLAGGAEAFTSSAVGIALPRIAGGLAASPDEISWSVTLYLAAYAVTLPLTAWLSDTLGQKTYLGASIVLYATASVGCMLSGSLPVFLAWRMVAGVAGAAFVARALFTFTKELRGPVLTRALFIFIGGFSLKALGLPVGGYLVDSYSWRWLFAVPVLVMVLGALPALLRSTEVWPRHRRLAPDLPGLGLLAAGLGALFIVLSRGERDEWIASPTIVTLSLVAVVALPWFLRRQAQLIPDRRPIPLRVLGYRGMTVGVTLSFLAGIMLIGGLYVLPQFLLGVIHCDAYHSGWLMSLDAWALMGGLAIGAWTLGKVLTRSLLVLSGVLFSTSMLLLASRITSGTPIEALYVPMVLHGLGVGLALPPIGIFSFRALGADHALNGEGRALHYTARQVGGAVALALAVALLDRQMSVHSSRLVENLNALNAQGVQTLAAIARGLASHGLAPTAAGSGARLVLDRIVTREATVLAFRDLFWVTAAVGPLVSALALALPKLRAPRRAAALPAAIAPLA